VQQQQQQHMRAAQPSSHRALLAGWPGLQHSTLPSHEHMTELLPPSLSQQAAVP
jgi:hypothetical protein